MTKVLAYTRAEPKICDECGTPIDGTPCEPHDPDCQRPADGCGCDWQVCELCCWDCAAKFSGEGSEAPCVPPRATDAEPLSGGTSPRTHDFGQVTT